MDTSSTNARFWIYKWMPGLMLFKSYKSKWLPNDLAAGLSVACIALPIGIAYSGIAGLPPETGLYSTILPMIAYALFGSSRQLVVGPDSATCMLIAASLAVYSATPAKYAAMSVLLSLMVGVLCILGGIFRLGFLANFLSKPILTGYLNGLAISIIIGQLGKLLGFDLIKGGFFEQAGDFITKLNQTHLITAIIGLSTFIFLRIAKKAVPKLPAPLFAVIGGICAVYFLGFQNSDVALVGMMPAGFPPFGVEPFTFKDLESLTGSAFSIVLICYCSAMLTNKSFAVKNGYEINPNQDFIALGVSNLFSGFSHGFVISGADSRTAVSNNAGGMTQLTSVFASITLLIIMLFFMSPISLLPVSSLAAIIISAVIGLFNFEYMKRLYIVSRREFFTAAFTSLCVITIGVLAGVLITIALAVLRLLIRAINPGDIILGKADNVDAYQDIKDNDEVKPIPGMLIFRYKASLLFFNADNMRARIRSLIASADVPVKTVIIDASPFVTTDITGIETLGELHKELAKQNIVMGVSRADKEFSGLLNRSGIAKEIGEENFFHSIRDAVEHFMKK